MEPAFTSSRQASAFALLLLALLALPAVVGRTGALDRAQVYPTIPVAAGPYAYIHRQIFEEKGELDIAFVGSSFMWAGINTPYVQQQLTAALGREAKVVTLASVWPGLDRDYALLKDLLSRRKVKLLVLNFPNRELPTDDPDFVINRVSATPHIQAFRFYRAGEFPEVADGLPFTSQASLYASAVLGMPRHLLSRVRPDFTAPAEAELELGAHKVRRGYYGAPYAEWRPAPPAIDPEEMIYRDATRSSFRFYQEPMPPYQMHFVRLIGQLLRETKVPVAILHIPHACERKVDAVEERLNWPELLGVSALLIGVPPARLFAGLGDEEIKRLYSSDHLNDNGNAYFTRAVTPALVRVFTEHEKKP
ncbi:MAG: hypothetical protein HZA89_00915 [Verrucomicrobia bacterium]|nr:hypothetical protein [Verrucomicrobiota bacterium]